MFAACVADAQSQSLAGATRVSFSVAGSSGEENLFGHLFMPAAIPPDGRVPAVVLVHGSGGVRDLREGYWGREFATFGVATLAIDSFTPRGITSTVDDQSRVSFAQMVRDALGALAFLAKQPSIDGKRVAVMGMSRGGSVALQAADQRETSRAGVEFAAHIPLYPGCTIQYRNPRMRQPILMLIGAKDDYTGVKTCAEYAERIRSAGGRVELKTYEGAHHGFDGDTGTLRDNYIGSAQNFRDCVILVEDDGRATLENNGEPVDYSDMRKAIGVLGRICMRRGATVAYNPAARQKATEDVRNFLKTHLMQ